MKKTLPRVLVTALALGNAGCSVFSASPSDAVSLSIDEVSGLLSGVGALPTIAVDEIGISVSIIDVALTEHQRRGGPGGDHGGMGGNGVLATWGPRGGGVHGATTVASDRDAQCPHRGTLRVTDRPAVVDPVARTSGVTSHFTEAPRARVFPVDSLNATPATIANLRTVIVVTGATSLLNETSSGCARESSRIGVARAAAAASPAGSFACATRDGRSG